MTPLQEKPDLSVHSLKRYRIGSGKLLIPENHRIIIKHCIQFFLCMIGCCSNMKLCILLRETLESSWKSHNENPIKKVILQATWFVKIRSQDQYVHWSPCKKLQKQRIVLIFTATHVDKTSCFRIIPGAKKLPLIPIKPAQKVNSFVFQLVKIHSRKLLFLCHHFCKSSLQQCLKNL